MAQVRLQRFLSQAGVAARRKAEQLITSGRVEVNGRIVTELGSKVDPERDRVRVDGQAVQPEDLFYVLFNKPKACITAVSDPQGRRTVMEYLPGLPSSVRPVGRLDFYSEGVLLLTNDGDLAAKLLAPATHVEKTYHVKIKGQISDAEIERLRSGVRLDARTLTRPAEVDRLKSQSRHDWLVITLTEGKSRQIHRMLEALGHQVLKLQRVAFASLTFHGLRVGDARELTQAEVNELRDMVGLGKSTRATSRGKWKAKREASERARRARDKERGPGTPSPTPGGTRSHRAALRAPARPERGKLARSGGRSKSAAEGRRGPAPARKRRSEPAKKRRGPGQGGRGRRGR